MLRLDPGDGSAPGAHLRLRPASTPDEGPWRDAFLTWRGMLEYVVPQDRVLVTRAGRPCRLEIDLGIPLDACEPLLGDVDSGVARAIAGDALPFAFRVPAVSFHFREARWEIAANVTTSAE